MNTKTECIIYVPEGNLRAMLHLAGKEAAVRFYLDGLKLEATPAVTRLVATDGHVLGALENKAGNDTPNVIPGGYFECIIPRELIEHLPKAKPGFIAAITVTQIAGLHPRRGSIVINCGGFQVSGEAIDANYPPYQKVIPEAVTGEAGLYDLELLNKFAAFAKTLGYTSHNIQLRQNGSNDAALVTLSKLPNFVGAVVPMTPDTVDEKAHLWARTTLHGPAKDPEQPAA